MHPNIPGFKILQEIHRSERTCVYKANREKDGKSTIIKTVNAQYPTSRQIARFQHEYKILSMLPPDGIIQAFGLEQVGHNVALILEDFGDESLSSLLERKGGATLDFFLSVAIKSAKALGTIHQHNIIHKDINPRNILFNSQTGEVRIIDFDIATELPRERQNINISNRLEGSLPYISPEQTGRMNRDLDYRTDFYSLGVTFFELLAGRIPFFADDILGWIYCHISKGAPDLRDFRDDIPKTVSKIVEKLMSKNMEDRYKSAYGLVSDLEECERQWKTSGKIENFTLGKRDVSGKLRIPQKLYGRESELETRTAAGGRLLWRG